MDRERLIIIFLALFIFSVNGVSAPSAALGYSPKYSPGFDHFDYVQPDAPRGGTLTLSGFGDFDSFNPYILKGVSADGLSGLVFEPLMVQSADEPYSVYAHIADDIELAEDGLSVTFRINPEARFSNGDPVLAEDVKFSFDTIKSDKGHPRYRFYWADIREAVVVDPRTVRFEFSQVNPELHMIAAQIPVFSRKWVGDVPFDKLTRELPVGTGPYVISRYNLGKDVVFERDPEYWARNLNTRRGMYNFDRIIFKYYRDSTVELEALKAGEFDFKHVNHSKQWARDYAGPQFDDGRISKQEFRHRNNAGMQGFVFNLRRPKFQDPRVRKAIALAFDFAWSNRNLFYNQYERCDSYFSNSELASSGLPEGKELELLRRYDDDLPAEVFTTVWEPASTVEPGALRRNLREAKRLLEEAGWKVSDGKLRNAKGELFQIEFLLAQKGFERILAPFGHNLAKLGIELRYRTVDVSLYVRRRRTFDFDMMVASFSQSQSPGNELLNLWSSSAADQEGSNNIIGIMDPAIDALIREVIYAPDRENLVIASRALDRVMLHGDYLVPNWYIDQHRVAYWDKFERPETLPSYYEATNWALQTWWRRPDVPDAELETG